jgi:hypothetical protein
MSTDDNAQDNSQLDVASKNESNKKEAAPKMKSSNVMQIRGKDVATYEGILDYGHQFGIKSLEVDILQFPSDENGQRCICKARLETLDGRVFSDIADASPDNVPRGCIDSFPRIASTRCKSRTISDAFNVKTAMKEDADISPQEDGGGGMVIDADFSVVKPVRTQSFPVTYDGGGAKPASAKQLALITRLVEDRGESPEDAAIEMCGKPLDQLQGGEANTIIKHLTKK